MRHNAFIARLLTSAMPSFMILPSLLATESSPVITDPYLGHRGRGRTKKGHGLLRNYDAAAHALALQRAKPHKHAGNK